MSTRDTRSNSDLSHLSVQHIIQTGSGRGRGRGSRSPSPAPHVGQAFFANSHNSAGEAEVFEDAEMDQPRADASADELRDFAERAVAANRQLQSNQDRMTAALEQANNAAATAAAAAAQAMAALQTLSLNPTASSAQPPRRKRPDLPALDKNQIEIWVKRVEAAYTREGVTEAKDKFAFIESIIGVNMGPEINSFMFGDPTQANWTAFMQHLTDRYGPTKQQRCSVFLDGVKRDGRRPTALLAFIDERGRDVSLDDLKKELIIRELPNDIKKLLQDKTEGLDAAATAKLADSHFDKDGKPLNATSSINEVSSAQELPESSLTSADDTDVNYVQSQSQRRGRPNQSRGGNNGGRNSNSGPTFTPAFGNRSASRPRQPPASVPPTQEAQQGAYVPCYHHSRDQNAPTCGGPKCPLHAKATYCNSRTCKQHGRTGNDRGGRR